MAQHDYNIANQGFSSFRSDLNNALSAIQTTNSGTSLPTGAVAGQIWLDTTNATSPTLKFYDGTDSISLAIIDYTTNTVNWLDSSLSYNSTATSAGTLTLTVSSSYKQYFTGTTTHTVTLPVASTLTVGQTFEIHNNSTGSITVNSSGSNLVGTVQANVTAECTCILASGTTAASWDFDVTGFTSSVPTTRGGTGLTSIGTSLQVLRVNSGATALEFASASGGTSWQSVQTTGFTATAGYGYPCNTTSAAFTVTLPASPSVGDYVQLVDYAGTFATNNITLGRNSNKIEGGTTNKLLTTNREAVTLTYVDSTQGWVASSGTNFGTQSLDPILVDFLVIAGGGAGGGNYRGGGGGAGGYRNSYLTETSGGGGSSEASLALTAGEVYTVTVGAGGTGVAASDGNNGNNSSISGTGITTITSTGGGGGGNYNSDSGTVGKNGGSGGGGGGATPARAGGSGTANQGFAGGSGSSGGGNLGGGGGGASAVGFNGNNGTNGTDGDGGDGLASSITGSSVSRAGGGGSGNYGGSNVTVGGVGGGGAGGSGSSPYVNGVAGTANTGGGGGGASGNNTTGTGGNGGKGVVILRMPTASYSGTTTGSPTVTTSGADTILVFNDSGSYTG